jgi:1-aminocyclopropane-1-carboxylate deaminase
MLLTVSNSTDFALLSAAPRWRLLESTLLQQRKIELWVCQLDLPLSAVSGNKYLKLKYHLAEARAQQKSGILTFGGAFSNHLYAVAAACQQLGWQSQAYVRTEQLDLANPTLRFCAAMGMQLQALDRQHYRLRQHEEYLSQLQAAHPQLLLVPEGGSSAAGAKGIAELDLATTPAGQADIIVCATASGGTLAGIINRHHQAVLGIAVVKDASLMQRVQQLLTAGSADRQWMINKDFTGAGYGRFTAELLQFCRDMAQQHLYIEPIYTGKALAGLFSLIAQGKVAPGSRLSFFHTGGLQGLQGLYYRGLITAADLALLSGSTVD